ncbi:MAG TPA: diaminopimelate decarboxylase [Gemmatimonadales bacterium]
MGAGVLDSRLSDAGLAPGSDGALAMSGIPLPAIAESVGTPAFVYDAATIRRQFARLDDVFGEIPHRICYAVKANSNLAILRIFATLGAGADIVSGGELLRAIAAGFDPSRIIFSGVGKSDEELLAAMAAGVGHINVESLAELERIALLVDMHDCDVTIGVRINPDVTAETHPYITTGKGGLKFGIPVDQFADVLRVLDNTSRIRLGAVAMHIGSQLLKADPYAAGMERLLALLDVARRAGHAPDVLDLGGGIGIRYQDEIPLDPIDWIEPLRTMMTQSGCTIQIEPGRFLVGSAGVMLTRVLYCKHSGGREIAVVDSGMNDLVRPSLYKAWHEIVPVVPSGAAPIKLDVVGPVCETGDFLALERPMAPVAQGDLLAVLAAGAYGFAMSSNYNSRARAAEVLVDAGRWAVVRPRERLSDLFRDEIADPFATEDP